MKEYDEFSLLMLTMGRCEQDDCYLEEIPSDPLPELLSAAGKPKLMRSFLWNVPAFWFFPKRSAKVVDITGSFFSCIAPYLHNQDRFNTVEVQPDGYGVYWNDQAMISHRALYTHGVTIPITLDALHHYVQNRVVSASEACGILDCSRQNIDDLMRRDKLHPIRTDAKYKLFSKAEVMQREKGITIFWSTVIPMVLFSYSSFFNRYLLLTTFIDSGALISGQNTGSVVRITIPSFLPPLG